MSISQYLKDTRAELHHVAWPTRTQTSIFTALVIAISILVSLYLGIFDYLFTTGLGKGLEYVPSARQGNLQVSLPESTTTPIEVPAANEQ